jgi:hypothetical protein
VCVEVGGRSGSRVDSGRPTQEVTDQAGQRQEAGWEVRFRYDSSLLCNLKLSTKAGECLSLFLRASFLYVHLWIFFISL